jgi:dolichol-phosphate mannosyltransferase
MMALAQAAAGAAVLRRLARGRHRRPPLAAPARPPAAAVSVVVPARDEEARIGPCLAGLVADPDVHEVIFVDDGSSDGTARLAQRMGARVVAAGEPPPGWVGKQWALQRGLEAATGEVVVSVDADTRPRHGLARALAAALADADLVSAGARFICEGAGERLLHAAMLATLVYRYGPPDAPGGARLLVNGQCTALRRRALLDAGGYAACAGNMTGVQELDRGRQPPDAGADHHGPHPRRRLSAGSAIAPIAAPPAAAVRRQRHRSALANPSAAQVHA